MILNRLANKITRYIELPFILLNWQVKKSECKSFKDNLKLLYLVNRAPRYLDRDLEYPWVIRSLSLKQGKLLDIGSTAGELLFNKLPKEIEISTLNLNRTKVSSNVKFIQGDIRKTDLNENVFDAITCISTLEHIGVEGRYGVKRDEYGDLKAMKEMLRILKPGGRLYLTVPYGAKDVLPINKLYNKERVSELFKGYKVISSEYQKYDKENKYWFSVPESEAAKTNWIKDIWYSIAFYILEKP